MTQPSEDDAPHPDFTVFDEHWDVRGSVQFPAIAWTHEWGICWTDDDDRLELYSQWHADGASRRSWMLVIMDESGVIVVVQPWDFGGVLKFLRELGTTWIEVVRLADEQCQAEIDALHAKRYG